MKNYIYAFFIRLQGEATGVISMASEEKWKRVLKNEFSVEDAEVLIFEEEDWDTKKIKSKTFPELKKKFPEIIKKISDIVTTKGVPKQLVPDVAKKTVIIGPNPLSGLVVFTILFCY